MVIAAVQSSTRRTACVIAIVHGAPLDPSFAADGLEEALPGSSFGPSSTTIGDVLAGNTSQVADTTPRSYAASAGHEADKALSRVGARPHRFAWDTVYLTKRLPGVTSARVIRSTARSNQARAQDWLRSSSAARQPLPFPIPVQLSPSVVSNSQTLSGYCDDNRLNAVVVPAYGWNLTGGPRYNGYGVQVGYSGTATVTADFFVFDCFGIPFFVEQKTKSENRYFAHRTPDREIVDMTNDLLDQLMRDFAQVESQRSGAWSSLPQSGIAIDPNDQGYHSLLYFQKKPAGYQVMAVAPNGPAAQAGIAVQDVIVKVNGLDTETLSVSEVIQEMNKPNIPSNCNARVALST